MGTARVQRREIEGVDGTVVGLGVQPMEGDRNVVRRDSGDEGYGGGAVLHGDKVRLGCRGGW